ncbi:hypothetical protein FOF52_17250 [Thermobifida alba]|jgi:uncharacterized protein YukE|uniref:Uncharacterized protein n=1 Tax=Thermobifida alba TaxID=53522 RepID=A0ABY4L4B5_THEAE|nr:hypothetical protein [Thermobifida alba]UPT22492.1 hypothetical protein FOF52_17250 [Thermobifida alba]
MNAYVGLTQADALGTGGQQLGIEAEGLRGQLNNLIADMENDGQSLQGSALAEFRKARSELNQRFDELIAWCNNNGIKLGEAQTQVTQTDDTSGEEFSGAGSGLGGLARPINL